MKFVILLFSGTGNTWWTAKEFKRQLESYEHLVDIISIENKEFRLKEVAARINGCDIMGVAYPVYSSEMPPIMIDYLTRLAEHFPRPQKVKRRALSITTMGWFSGDGALTPAPYLEKLGFELSWAYNFVMPFNMGIPNLKFGPPPEEEIEEKKRIVKEKIAELSAKIRENRKSLQGRGLWDRFLGWGQRFFSTSMMHKLNIAVNEERCVRCGICWKSCPTGNIIYHQSKDSFSTKKSCTYCLRCYNFCPKLAIKVYGKSSEKEKHIQFRGPVKNFELKSLKDNYIKEERHK